MSIRINQNSFSRGIISPSLQGRVDLDCYSSGVKKLNNGIVLQEGCIVNRSGLEYIGEAKYSDKKTRLIPFVFGLEQNYIIEMGSGYFRFIKDGGYILNSSGEIYEITSPYKEEDLFEIDYVQQSDVITLVHNKYPVANLSRISHNDWTYKNATFGSSITSPATITTTYKGSTSSNTQAYYYMVCAVDKTTNEESVYLSNGACIVAHKAAYWTTTEYVTITWTSVKNAIEYNIYKNTNGIFGYIGTTTSTSFVDNNIEPDITSCPPKSVLPFASEYPSCVCYYQQRKVFASTQSYPQTIWASQSGTNGNFNVSRTISASDGINLSLYDNVANTIHYLIPFDDLIVMSSNAEWSVYGKDGIFCANPAPIASIQSYYGCAKIKPAISGSMVLFVESGGNTVRDLGYNYLSDSYDGEDLTIYANHLFENKKIKDMAYTKEPYRILWCVMNDGTINALTYNPKQKISAWHTHSTQGEFESVTTIKENNEDVTYFIVKRTINSKTKRYVERLKSRNITSLKDSFFLDCALKKEFETEVDNISGLEHLANEKVVALLDYEVYENLVVNSEGKVTLPCKAKEILIGLPYVFEFESLNIESINTMGIKKTINTIDVKILNSREDFFVKNDNETLTQNKRCSESYKFPEKVFNKSAHLCLISNATEEANIKLIQKNPLPINILSISATITLQDIETQ